MRNYIKAIATLIGTIIGVGIFTIPYVTVKAGILPTLILLPVLAVVQYYLHLIFAEIILSVKEKHRLPGYAEKYYGNKGKIATFIIDTIGNYGSILAYIVVGGLFFTQLLQPYFGGSDVWYATAIFLIQALIVFFGLKWIAGSEELMTVVLIVAVGAILWRGWGYLDFSHLNIIEWKNIALPYGPIFFAVGGSAAIPELCRLLHYDKHSLKSAIAWGTFIPAAVTLLFVAAIVGVTGASTTPDALSGLSVVFQNGVMKFALIFGLLAIVTSFIITAQSVKEVYYWDYDINKTISWALACLVPFAVYLLGWNDLIRIIGFTGGITGGLSGMILIWLALKTKANPECPSCIKVYINKPIAVVLSLFFILGMVYEVWTVAG